MNNNTQNKRKSVEIYFILYLAALLFLLPDKKDKSIPADDQMMYNEFAIYPEKTNLNALYYLDKNGVKILQIDSVNNVYANGKYENISFNYTIIDPLTNRTLEISENMHNDIFNVINDKKNHSSKFLWNPEKSVSTNKSYIVAVNALVSPENDKSKIYQSKTQFTLNIIYKNKPEIDSAKNNEENIAQNVDRILDSLRKIQNTQVIYVGDFDINPEKQNIAMPSMLKWNNTINFYNINVFKDLSDKPKIEITGSAPAKYRDIAVDIQQNKINFTGIIPPSGNIRVKVSAERRSDGQIKSTSFTIKPVPIDEPLYDKVMYAGKTYAIDPKLPLINRNAYAEVRSPNQKLAWSEQGTKFYYTPTGNDIGKSISLRRFLDNNLIDEDLKITILDYPQPEIISIQRLANDDIEIKTKSYGNYNSEKNLITQINSNVDINYRELYGNMEESKDKFTYIQTFIITLKKRDEDNSLTFTITDKSGKVSVKRVFNY